MAVVPLPRYVLYVEVSVVYCPAVTEIVPPNCCIQGNIVGVTGVNAPPAVLAHIKLVELAARPVHVKFAVLEPITSTLPDAPKPFAAEAIRGEVLDTF